MLVTVPSVKRTEIMLVAVEFVKRTEIEIVIGYREDINRHKGVTGKQAPNTIMCPLAAPSQLSLSIQSYSTAELLQYVSTTFIPIISRALFL
jgi:hypothetical protein